MCVSQPLRSRHRRTPMLRVGSLRSSAGLRARGVSCGPRATPVERSLLRWALPRGWPKCSKTVRAGLRDGIQEFYDIDIVGPCDWL